MSISPTATSELVAVLQDAGEAGRSVLRRWWDEAALKSTGAEPDVELSTAGLDRIVEHNVGDLTAVLEVAGWRARATDARQPQEDESGVFAGRDAHCVYDGGCAVALGYLDSSHAGGEPQRWLQNATGLTWTGPRQVLFSEKRNNGGLGIVTAQEGRIGQHDVYIPLHDRGMTQRSHASPDGKWVLLAEITGYGNWGPCRVVPMDGSSQGRQVGPPGG